MLIWYIKYLWRPWLIGIFMNWQSLSIIVDLVQSTVSGMSQRGLHDKQEKGFHFPLRKALHPRKTQSPDSRLPTCSTIWYLIEVSSLAQFLFSTRAVSSWTEGKQCIPTPRNSKCLPTLSVLWEKHITLRMLGKENLPWRKPASFTAAPSQIAARNWFDWIPYSTARHWINLYASSSAFMLLARISNLTSLSCIFHLLSMKRTVIANASPKFHVSSLLNSINRNVTVWLTCR